MNNNWSTAIGSFFAVVALVVVSGLLFEGCDRYNERKSDARLACIDSGGGYVPPSRDLSAEIDKHLAEMRHANSWPETSAHFAYADGLISTLERAQELLAAGLPEQYVLVHLDTETDNLKYTLRGANKAMELLDPEFRATM